MSLYEDLQKARQDWQSRNYNYNIYKSQLEQRRENEINAISNLIYKYETTGFFSDSEIRFANKLIVNSRK